ELGDRAEAIAGRVDAIATILGRHASVINAIDGIDEQVAAIARQIADLAAVSSAAEEDTCQPGSSTSTSPATGISRQRSRSAGNGTRSACTRSTGSASCGPSST